MSGQTSHLFSEFTLRGLTFKNRIFLAPMCQYSSKDGMANDWHLVHLGSRAAGGAALVMVEATGVAAEGRISPWDVGLWNDEQGHALARVAAFIKSQDSVPAIQLAHAGRKASTAAPWDGGQLLVPGALGWQPVAPSAVPFDDRHAMPRALSVDELQTVKEQFVAATQRSLAAGFEVVELHMAHGYLLHEFLSPISNLRTDQYGGALEGRMKFPLEVAQAVRGAWPDDKPLFVRISASDWTEGGWDLMQSKTFAAELKKLGIDLIDCSSGGMVPNAKIHVAPGYQVPFAEAIRKEVGIATGAVGLITTGRQAEDIIAEGQADVVLLGRAMLKDPYWPHRAAEELGVKSQWPKQYGRR